MRLVLSLVSSQGSTTAVKRWGPLSTAGLLGVWHHLAATLRFARVVGPSGSCTTPAAVLTQAHLFLDGQSLPDDGTFLSLDLEKSLSVDRGLVSLMLGGPDSNQADASSYQYFVGAMDNLRVWWPTCPTSSNPSRCNPYAFLYPVLRDGSRLPAAGMADSDVRLETIAAPVRDYMLVDDAGPAAQQGLLVYLTFDGQTQGGIIQNQATWTGPGECRSGSTYGDVCDGCADYCSFDNAAQFDRSCLAGGGVTDALATEAAQQFYSDIGTCTCADTASCPKLVQVSTASESLPERPQPATHSPASP